MDTGRMNKDSVEVGVAKNVGADSSAAKDMVEETKGRSGTPLQNISNSSSSDEINGADEEDLAPPAKRICVDSTVENVQSKESVVAEEVVEDKGVEGESETLTEANGIISTSPEGEFNVVIYKDRIALKGEDGMERYTIPIDSIGRLFVLPQERHSFLVLALIAPLAQVDPPIAYVVLELPAENKLTRSCAEMKNSKSIEETGDPVSSTTTEPLAKAMPKLIASLCGLDLEISVHKSSFSPSTVLSVACAHNGESGYLFPLEDGFFFVHKPPMHVAFSDVFSSDFVGSKHSEKLSDFILTMKDGIDVVFSDIEKGKYGLLNVFDIERSIAEGGKRLRRDLPSGSNLVAQDNDEDSDDDDYIEDRAKIKEKEEGYEADPQSDSNSEPLEEYESNVEDTTQEEIDEDIGDEEEEEELGEEKIVEVGDEQKEGGTANAKTADGNSIVDMRENVELEKAEERSVVGSGSLNEREQMNKMAMRNEENIGKVHKEELENDGEVEEEKEKEEKELV
ncbi:FACT complex subunit Ssrp1 [Toxocara canis]|uniref:FACT complex subunit SSRP1 n=1 Tax=Toxocara canis TaxID=6265 RepID=A0A0B2VPZ5_TOXCA|nr:FACT complex subunit Ssrp1 [Toxocara canis]